MTNAFPDGVLSDEYSDLLYLVMTKMRASPWLTYHNYQHADRVVRTAVDHWQGADLHTPAPLELVVAALCHDVIYVVGNDTNEELSAAWAVRACRHTGLADKYNMNLPLLNIMIELTKLSEHLEWRLPFKATRTDMAIACLLDADFAGLGASWDEFVKHNADIANESRILAESSGSSVGFCKSLLQRYEQGHPLYFTPYGRRAYSERAVVNLNRYINLNAV